MSTDALLPEPTSPVTIPVLDLDVFGHEFLADPYAFHDVLRETGPVVWLSSYGIYGMARHAEVMAALKDWETFLSGRGVGLSDFAKEKPWRPHSLLLETDPPVHERTRAIMNRIVTIGALRELRPAWSEHAERLVEQLAARRHVDAVTDLAETFPLLVFPDTIGLPARGREHLLDYAAATFNAFGPHNALFEETNRKASASIAWVGEACKRENLDPAGWGGAVYRAVDDGLCTEEEAYRLVRSFLTAGIDTTINGIGNMLHAFSTHPEEWRKLRENPALTKKAFEESLRWDSTVQTFFRTTSRPVEMGGTVIPEGAKVLLFLAAANRDPRRWERSDTFEIDRSASGHVAFGFGIHQCLGQMVSRVEAEVVLEALLRRVEVIRPTAPPRRRLNNTLHALSSLPVEFQ